LEQYEAKLTNLNIKVEDSVAAEFLTKFPVFAEHRKPISHFYQGRAQRRQETSAGRVKGV
jgi:hypothetical protein